MKALAKFPVLAGMVCVWCVFAGAGSAWATEPSLSSADSGFEEGVDPDLDPDEVSPSAVELEESHGAMEIESHAGEESLLEDQPLPVGESQPVLAVNCAPEGTTRAVMNSPSCWTPDMVERGKRLDALIHEGYDYAEKAMEQRGNRGAHGTLFWRQMTCSLEDNRCANSLFGAIYLAGYRVYQYQVE